MKSLVDHAHEQPLFLCKDVSFIIAVVMRVFLRTPGQTSRINARSTLVRWNRHDFCVKAHAKRARWRSTGRAIASADWNQSDRNNRHGLGEMTDSPHLVYASRGSRSGVRHFFNVTSTALF